MKKTTRRRGARPAIGFDHLDRRDLLSIGIPGDGYLDITFIGDGYTAVQLSDFRADAARAEAALLAAEPFRSRADQIRFHRVDNTQPLGASRDPAILYGDSLFVDAERAYALIEASGETTDFACAIVNDATYGGSGGGNLAVSYNGASLGAVILHEFGHAFGQLVDEYLYGTPGELDGRVHSLDPASPAGNAYAGTPVAAAWDGLVAPDEYFLGAGPNNWYRPSLGSVMGGKFGTASDTFNAPSLAILTSRLDYWAGASADRQAPRATITGPRGGESVGGVVHVTSDLADDRAVVRAQLWVDGVLARNETNAPFVLDWTTGDLAAGPHSLEVRAYDASGNVGVSQAVEVILGTPADLEITSPVNGQVLTSEDFAIGLDLWDDGIDSVSLEIDGRLAVYNWTPYLNGLVIPHYVWGNGPRLGAGAHTLAAIGSVSHPDQSHTVEVARATTTFTLAAPSEPAIAIQSPPPGGIVSKQVSLGVALLGGGEPIYVAYSVDGKSVGVSGTAPYTLTWDTRKKKDGAHTIQAVASYASGQMVTATATFVIRNAIDRQAPTITVSSPRNNARYKSGPLVIAGKARDNVGVRSVELYLDGQLVSSSSSAQFRWETDVSTLAPGRHKVRARAIDLSGNARWSGILAIRRV